MIERAILRSVAKATTPSMFSGIRYWQKTISSIHKVCSFTAVQKQNL